MCGHLLLAPLGHRRIVVALRVWAWRRVATLLVLVLLPGGNEAVWVHESMTLLARGSWILSLRLPSVPKARYGVDAVLEFFSSDSVALKYPRRAIGKFVEKFCVFFHVQANLLQICVSFFHRQILIQIWRNPGLGQPRTHFRPTST